MHLHFPRWRCSYRYSRIVDVVSIFCADCNYEIIKRMCAYRRGSLLVLAKRSKLFADADTQLLL